MSGGYTQRAEPPVLRVAATILTTLDDMDDPDDEQNGLIYGYSKGTSMAAPMVSGAAALVWSLDPSLSAAEVKAILTDV